MTNMKNVLSKLTFIISSSGLSCVTTCPRSCSSRPAGVTVKFISVVCAWSSGGKCGLACLVCRTRRNSLLYSHSLSPILMYLQNQTVLMHLCTQEYMVLQSAWLKKSCIYAKISEKHPPRHQYSLNEANRKRWQLLPIATTSKKVLNKLEDDIPISQYLSQSAFQLNQACLVKHGGV